MKVRIVNNNVFDHVEKFRGDTVRIPAGGFIEMEREDAVLFKSNFFPPKFNGNGLQTPESMKMLKLEPIPDKKQAPEIPVDKDLVCQACGFVAKTPAGLKSHIRANHASEMIDDDARKEIEEA